MKKFWTKLLFMFRNRVIRKGEIGGFKYVFRNFSLDISTISGNFKARWTADKDPFGVLLANGEEGNIHGFAVMVYLVSKWLTADEEFAEKIEKAILEHEKLLEKDVEVVEDETEEKIALEEVKQVQEVVEMGKKERRKYERDVNGRFKAAVKEVEKK